MTVEDLKKALGFAALDYIVENTIIGIGTGSTVNYFIDALANKKSKIEGTVASSKASEARLKSLGIPVFELNSVNEISVYIDSADACNLAGQLVKGGGGALTGEKILAAASKEFICIIDEAKKTPLLGEFPIAIEVIPMARSFVAREIVKLGGNPVYRQGFVTDHGNILLDVYNWRVTEPLKLENTLNNIPGVVCNGIFAMNKPNRILVSGERGISLLNL